MRAPDLSFELDRTIKIPNPLKWNLGTDKHEIVFTGQDNEKMLFFDRPSNDSAIKKDICLAIFDVKADPTSDNNGKGETSSAK